MAHTRERKLKNCLNCNKYVKGRFCQNCGQENIEIKQGFWPMAKHFVYDIFHFDGKFFVTMRLLMSRPGKVAKDYTEGKRASYLDPVRMYLFLSAITFFLFPLFINVQDSIDEIHIMATPSERLREASKSFVALKRGANDDDAIKKMEVLLDTTVSLQLKNINDTAAGNAIDMHIDNQKFLALPVKNSVVFPERNPIEKRISKNMRKKFEKKGEDLNQLIASQNNMQWKMMPYLLFLSLPVFSFMLQALYKKNKMFHYSDHAVFTLYHYILAFGYLLIALALVLLANLLHLNITVFIYSAFLLLLPVYLLFEMKNFYRQELRKILPKFLLLSFLSLLSLFLLYLIFVFLMLIV